MSFETGKKCIDTLFAEDEANSTYINSQDAEIIVLDFIGGEPMLEIELIDQICDYFLEQAIARNHRWALKYMISMSSNGTLYFNENVQKFMKKHKGRLSIGITIDGDKELHDKCRLYADGTGSYDDAAAAFKDILNNYLMDGTKITLAPANISYFSQAVKHMFEEFGIHFMFANCCFEEGWKDEHATILYNQLKEIADYIIDNDYEATYRLDMFDINKYKPMDLDDDQNWCGGTGKMLAFGVDGTIYPCLRYAPYSLGPDVEPLIVGNISHGIEKTEKEQATCAMLRGITRTSQSTDECINCPIANGCSWCSAYNYEKFGTPNHRATYICCMHKAEALGNVYYWNKLAKKLGIKERIPMRVPREWAIPIIGEEEYDKLCKMADE